MKKISLILFLLFYVTISGMALTYTSQYPTQDTDHVKATTTYSSSYYPHFTTDPTTSLTGSMSTNQWLSTNGDNTDQRFHIDLGSAVIIRRIYYDNGHNFTAMTIGVQDFTFWGSNTASGTFDDLVYANDDGWTELTCSQNSFDQHAAEDSADPRYITVTNTTAYQYYAFKCEDNYGAKYMGWRRLELQTEDGYGEAEAATSVLFTMGDF